MAAVLRSITALLASYGLSCVLLLLLFVLTWLGTLAQVEHGLYSAQKQYFESWFVLAQAGPVVIPLPGGVPVMGLLAVNLAVGGLWRMRKSRRTLGILITHIGIAVMLMAALVKFAYSHDGYTTLYPGERAAHFANTYDWEVAITRQLPDGNLEERRIPQARFADLIGPRRELFTGEGLPFGLELGGFQRNCEPRRKGPMFRVPVAVVDGIYLHELPPRTEAELNIAGLYAAVIEPDGSRREAVLWGWPGGPTSTATAPWVVRVGDTDWGIELRHVRYELPFELQLDDFEAEFHPRTRMASNYESTVTHGLADEVRSVRIRMNEPLRHGNYAIFQATYGPSNAPPGTRLYSGLSVVYNPSDQWPLYSCIIIAIGLLLHFGSKLGRYAKSEQRRTT